MNPCRRMTVYALANGIMTTNGNEQECTGEIGKCGCTHAEINLLKKVPRPDHVIVSHSPCIDCAVALVKAGVKTVIYNTEYRILRGVNYLKENGVIVIHSPLGDGHK